MVLEQVISGGIALLENLLIQYGIWMFLAAQFLRGMLLLFLIPDELVTPTYVLMAANTPADVVMIASISATAVLAGNLVVYTVFRLLGDRLLSEEKRRTGRWRLLSWAAKKHGKAAVLLFRFIPVFGKFIAIPAGLVRLKMRTFLIYSLIGLLCYELLIGFGTYYGIQEGLFFQTEIGRTAMFLYNTTLG